jgi:coenzyme F420-reducing hydrogenase beta subunit
VYVWGVVVLREGDARLTHSTTDEKNERLREPIRKKLTEYLERAEKLKEYLAREAKKKPVAVGGRPCCIDTSLRMPT